MGNKLFGAEKRKAAEPARDENEERGNWSSKLDFILSAIGYIVGLGNLWRFPYIAYANGGGSFLFPYVIMLIFAGLPLFFMEMGLGQFASLGPISIWKAVPFCKGIGVAMVIISALVCIYYNMIIAYIIYYLFASMSTNVPWQYCKEEWKALGCVDRMLSDEEKEVRNVTKQWCATMKHIHENSSGSTLMSDPDYIANCTIKEKNPSLVYWEHEVLGMSNSIAEGSSDFHWWLVLCFISSWVIVFFALIKGIKSSGKVVYVTATLPYVILFILLIRNATLEGSRDGIEFYIVPKWEELKSYKPWFAAAVQIFYSLGVAFGGLETFASYNKFHNNVQRDALVVALINCGTSVFAGFVIFAVIGHLAVRTGEAVGDVLQGSGPGLAFVAYPEGIAMMPIAPLWAILFFFMLFTLGLDTQFALMETVITSISDEFPCLRKSKRKIVFTLFLCILFFLIGLPQCAANGVFVMELFNWYSAGFSLMVVAIFEIISISYIYGNIGNDKGNRFSNFGVDLDHLDPGFFGGGLISLSFNRFRMDLKMMLGPDRLFKCMFWPYWLPNWIFITPCLLLFIFVMSCVDYAPISYSGYPDAYPSWADRVGWLMVVAALIWIPTMAMVEYGKTHDWKAAWRRATSPREEWGPALPKYRTGHYGITFIPPPEYSVYKKGDMANPDVNINPAVQEIEC